jgi:hypothetical protein
MNKGIGGYKESFIAHREALIGDPALLLSARI